jgi:hypothetical protein
MAWPHMKSTLVTTGFFPVGMYKISHLHQESSRFMSFAREN